MENVVKKESGAVPVPSSEEEVSFEKTIAKNERVVQQFKDQRAADRAQEQGLPPPEEEVPAR